VETDPCGNAAKELAKAYNVTLNPVSEEQKVTDVRTKVESGEADAGVVYKTDAVAAKDKVDEVTIDNKGVVNHYPIAQTAKPSNPEAAQVFINAITGGSPLTTALNQRLAILARETGMAMATGSMSIAMKFPESAESFKQRTQN